MNGVANATLIGTVTRDPEYKDGRSWFSIAVNHKKDKVSFFDITVFKHQAEFVKDFVEKGAVVYLDCNMEWWQAETKKMLSLIANNVQVIKYAPWAPKKEKISASTKTITGSSGSVDDDVPF
jgi:single-stranded DNA-binding protein